ncbi:Uncharacterized protein DAT39_012507, partial [Clarias magur]
MVFPVPWGEKGGCLHRQVLANATCHSSQEIWDYTIDCQFELKVTYLIKTRSTEQKMDRKEAVSAGK